MKVFFLLLSVAATFGSVFSEQEVSCPDQEEFCACDVGETKCNFNLAVEELQTFTSYALDSGNKIIISRGNPGDVYRITGRGYVPAVPKLPENDPEIGSCHYNGLSSLIYKEHFRNYVTRCSFPMTVDGKSYRRFIAVNGRIPGPTLIVDEGAIVRVTVNNSLTSEGITIHWHGMHQRSTPWMDGVGFISQPPISPGALFDYVFRATPAGTHWYHSHVGAQRTDGLFGALIVRERNFKDNISPRIAQMVPGAEYEKIEDSPERHTMTLLDWQSEDSLSLFVQIHSTLGFWGKSIGVLPSNRDSLLRRTASFDKVEVGPVPYWSGLINGRGRMTEDTITPLSVFTVEPNKAYRFRIIGAQSLYAYRFSIDNHNLQVIASDGHFIEPQEVQFLIVHSGERYDVIVNTYNKDREFYWIRAETLENLSSNEREHSALAVLKYSITSDISNTDVDWRSGYSNINTVEHVCTAENKCNVVNCPFNEYSTWNCIHLHSLTAFFLDDSTFMPPLWYDEETCGSECLKFFNFGFEGVSRTSAVNAINFQLPVINYQTNCGQYYKDRNDNLIMTCTSTEQPRRCIHVAPIVSNQDVYSRKTVFMVLSAVGNMNRGFNNFSHPIHLHGHSFHVLYVGHGEYRNGELMWNSPDVTCGSNVFCPSPTWGRRGMPQGVMDALGDNNRIKISRIRKDTVIVPAGGYVVIAFKADNPGYWFLHCHIEVHQLEGMGVMIEEYPYLDHRRPPDGINRAGNFLLSISEYQGLSRGTCRVGRGEGTTATTAMYNLYNDTLAFALAVACLFLGVGCVCLTCCLICIISVLCYKKYWHRNRSGHRKAPLKKAPLKKPPFNIHKNVTSINLHSSTAFVFRA